MQVEEIISGVSAVGLSVVFYRLDISDCPQWYELLNPGGELPILPAL